MADTDVDSASIISGSSNASKRGRSGTSKHKSSKNDKSDKEKEKSKPSKAAKGRKHTDEECESPVIVVIYSKKKKKFSVQLNSSQDTSHSSKNPSTSQTSRGSSSP